jgi:hypothetical protein
VVGFLRGGYEDHGDQSPSMARAIVSAPTTASAMPALLLLPAVPSVLLAGRFF